MKDGFYWVRTRNVGLMPALFYAGNWFIIGHSGPVPECELSIFNRIEEPPLVNPVEFLRTVPYEGQA